MEDVVDRSIPHPEPGALKFTGFLHEWKGLPSNALFVSSMIYPEARVGVEGLPVVIT